jgi:transposase-like protein
MQKTSYSDKQKAQVALDALKGEKTINQISTQYQIHPTQIHKWKTIASEGLPGLFSQSDTKSKTIIEKEKLIEELYKIIGQRETELNWLKKKFNIFNL